MQIQTILLIILAAFVALGIVFFQYYYKSKKRGKLSVLLSFLRFIALFLLFLLLINPQLVKKDYEIEKTNLIVLVDNSSSMASSKAIVSNTIEQLKNYKAITDRFNINYYKFGKGLERLDSLDYHDSSTDITQAFNAISNIYARTNTVGLLVSDGNQTVGQDYEFYADKLKFPVYTIAVGDTTRYEDVRIAQVNTNKYAFLKNKFPIEIYVNYEGGNTITTPLALSINGKKVYQEQVNFSSTEKVKRVSTFLDATTVGLKNIVVNVGTLKNEKNIKNNSKTIAVEVIDEKTNVAIVSSILHPDIGALKKAIETNEQRSVTILKPNTDAANLEDIDLFICYQPDRSFDKVFNYILNKKASSLIVAGLQTDLNFLNSAQSQFKIETGFPEQEVFGTLNTSFSKFDISEFDIEEFPPLSTNSGSISFSGSYEALLNMVIRGVQLENPLLSVSEMNNSKTAVLLGENIWKWRVSAYKSRQNFQSFDDFIGKLVFYLADKEKKSRLNVAYQSVYENLGVAKVTATYFNDRFVFDSKAQLLLDLNGEKKIPMLLKGNYYEADLSALKAGDYNFVVSTANSKLTKSGKFTILDFDVEQQFLATNAEKLARLASITDGEFYYPDQTQELITKLMEDKRFLPTQRSTENVVSLIDYKILLTFIIMALAIEWFVRKYNGLI